MLAYTVAFFFFYVKGEKTRSASGARTVRCCAIYREGLRSSPHRHARRLQAERQTHRRAVALRTVGLLLRLRRLGHALAAAVAHVRSAHGDRGGLALRGNKAEHLVGEVEKGKGGGRQKCGWRARVSLGWRQDESMIARNSDDLSVGQLRAAFDVRRPGVASVASTQFKGKKRARRGERERWREVGGGQGERRCGGRRTARVASGSSLRSVARSLSLTARLACTVPFIWLLCSFSSSFPVFFLLITLHFALHFLVLCFITIFFFFARSLC